MADTGLGRLLGLSNDEMSLLNSYDDQFKKYAEKKVLVDSIVDGDGVGGARLFGIDAMESAGVGSPNNPKSKRIFDEQGISYEDQARLGLLAKQELKNKLMSNDYELADAGRDVFGRRMVYNQKLNEDLMATGLYVPTDRYDAKMQSLYHKAQEKSTRLNASDKELLEKQRQYNIDGQAPGIWDNITAPFKAAGTGAIQLAAGTADMVLDAGKFWGSGNSNLLDEYKSTKWADDAVGYNRKEANYLQAEMLNDWKQGNYGTALFDAARMAPEVLGESLPTMAAMVGTGGLGAVGGGVLGGARLAGQIAARGALTRGTATAADLAKIGTSGAELTAGLAQDAALAEKTAGWFTVAGRAAKLEGSTAAGNALGQIARFANNNSNLGFLTVVGEQTNEHIDEFTANNGGVGPSATDIARMAATNVLQLGLDKFVFKDIAMSNPAVGGAADKIGEFAKTMKQAAKVVTPDALQTVAKGVAKTALSMGEEAGQEYLQTWAEILNKQLGTTGHGSLESIWNDEKNQEEALTATLMGAGAGGATSTIGQPITAGVNALKNTANQRQADQLFALTEADDSRKYLVTEDANHFDDATDPYIQKSRQFGALKSATENADNGFASQVAKAAIATETITDDDGNILQSPNMSIGVDINGQGVDMYSAIGRMAKTVTAAIKGSNYDSLSADDKRGSDNLIRSTIADSGKTIIDNIYSKANNELRLEDNIQDAEDSFAGKIYADGSNRVSAIQKVISGFKAAGVDPFVIADIQDYIASKEIDILTSYAKDKGSIDKVAVENMLHKVQATFGHSPEDGTGGPTAPEEEYEKPITEIANYLTGLINSANEDGTIDITPETLKTLKSSSGVGREINKYGFVSGESRDGRISVSEHMSEIKKKINQQIKSKKIEPSIEIGKFLNFAAGRANGSNENAKFVKTENGKESSFVPLSVFNKFYAGTNYNKALDPNGTTALKKLEEARDLFLPRLIELRKYVELSMPDADGKTKDGAAFNDGKSSYLAKIDNAITTQKQIIANLSEYVDILSERDGKSPTKFYAKVYQNDEAIANKELPISTKRGKLIGYKLIERNIKGIKDAEGRKENDGQKQDQNDVGSEEVARTEDAIVEPQVDGEEDAGNSVKPEEEVVEDNQLNDDEFILDESASIADQIKALEQEIEYRMFKVANAMITTARSLVLDNFKYDDNISIAKNFLAWRKEIAIAARLEKNDIKASVAKSITLLTKNMQDASMSKKVIASAVRTKKADAKEEIDNVKNQSSDAKSMAYAKKQEEIVALRANVDQLKKKFNKTKQSRPTEAKDTAVYNENYNSTSEDQFKAAEAASKEERKAKRQAKERENVEPEAQDEAYRNDLTQEQQAEYDAALAELNTAMLALNKEYESESNQESDEVNADTTVVLNDDEDAAIEVLSNDVAPEYDGPPIEDIEISDEFLENEEPVYDIREKPKTVKEEKVETVKTEEEIAIEKQYAEELAVLEDELYDIKRELYNEPSSIVALISSSLNASKIPLNELTKRDDLTPDDIFDIKSHIEEVKGKIRKVGKSEAVSQAIDATVAEEINMLDIKRNLAILKDKKAKAQSENKDKGSCV